MEHPGDYSLQSLVANLPSFARPIPKIHQKKTLNHANLVRLLARRCRR
ncbi:hypothetical protein COLO4_37091 [Corchorus olitorius]|uniref:Uncharacterized protein n=1 Tax=Corchorus olitorius TaxID=93759 RepID=A0A1R3G3D7_9ROSI|nr:hypothetical protein COLO4_37091 [Corchorus olitorius]